MMKVITLEGMQQVLKLKSTVAANVFLFLLDKKSQNSYQTCLVKKYRNELMKKCNISSSQVTHALKVLIDAGFITGERGCYEFNPEIIDNNFGYVTDDDEVHI